MASHLDRSQDELKQLRGLGHVGALDLQTHARKEHGKTLPEAPASVNVRVSISGHDVQITLRDTNEASLLTWLATVLAQFPATPSTAPSHDEGWCQGRER